MSRGYVYVLSNPYFPGQIKIGSTKDRVSERMKALDANQLPGPFVLEGKALVPNTTIVKRKMHRVFSSVRINPDREFFACDGNDACDWLSRIVCESFTEPQIASARLEFAVELLALRAETGEIIQKFVKQGAVQ